MGIVVAKAGKKHLPSIKSKLKEFVKAWEDGDIELNYDSEFEEPTREKGHWDETNALTLMSNLCGHYTVILPTQWKQFDVMNQNLGVEILFVPSKFIHMIYLVTRAGAGINSTWKQLMFIDVLKHIPNWQEIDPVILASVIRNTRDMYRNYGTPDSKITSKIYNYLIDVRINNKFVTESEFDSFQNTLNTELESTTRHSYNLDYKRMFPEMYLKERALQLGYESKYIESNPNDKSEVWAYSDSPRDLNYLSPTKIGGEPCWIVTSGTFNPYNESFRSDIAATLDDNGKPVLVVNWEALKNIVVVERDGILKCRETITEWT